jgi:eukaryotic-like serine/threonine-protein kinase
MIAFSSGAVLKDRYRLERILGAGGMAAVWLGHDEVLDRPVAVKVLSDTISADPDFLARFRREATVAAGLSHPNLVDVYDYSESGERPYLVMEFVAGPDLGSLIAREVPIDRERLARELLEAVGHIHAAGIVHRDIKPHNIMIEADGTTKLIDFGIALPADATALTQTGMILATKRYAAPEVIAGRPADERSDLYSCGVVLAACGAGGSAGLTSLVAALTEEDRTARPRNAREAVDLLEEPIAPGHTTEAFTPTFARPVEPTRGPRQPERQGPPTRVYSGSSSTRGRWLAGGALLAVVAAVAIAVVLATGSGGGSPAGKGSPRTTAAAGSHVGNAHGKRKQPVAAADGEEAEPGSEEAEPSTEEAEPSTEEAEVEPEETAVAAPTEADPARGAELNQQGFELIQAGSPEEAVPILEEAVRAFPPGSEETEYAYALFNLGDALLRSGRPEAAIPVLEQRLQIPNQTDVVRRELETAEAELR